MAVPTISAYHHMMPPATCNMVASQQVAPHKVAPHFWVKPGDHTTRFLILIVCKQASSQAAPATEAPCNAQDALAPPNHTHKNAEVRSAVAAVPLRGVQSQADAAASEAAGANPAVSAGMPAVNVCPGAADALAAQAAAATAAANLEAHAWRRRVECGGVGGGERWARELGSARAVSSRCAEEQGLGLGRGVGPTSTAGAVHGVQGGDADADDAQASCRWAAAAAAAAAGLSPAEAAGAHVVQGVSPSAGDFGHAQGVQKNVTVYEADGAPCGAYAQQHTQLQACAPDGGVQGAPTPSSHPVSSCLSGGPSVERSQSALQASEQGAPTPSSHPVSSCLSGGPSAVSVEWSQSASQASGQGVLHQLHHNNGEARSQVGGWVCCTSCRDADSQVGGKRGEQKIALQRSSAVFVIVQTSERTELGNLYRGTATGSSERTVVEEEEEVVGPMECTVVEEKEEEAAGPIECTVVEEEEEEAAGPSECTVVVEKKEKVARPIECTVVEEN
eukprot:1138975-Pelagomonas_calceolata.AAC.2